MPFRYFSTANILSGQLEKISQWYLTSAVYQVLGKLARKACLKWPNVYTKRAWRFPEVTHELSSSIWLFKQYRFHISHCSAVMQVGQLEKKTGSHHWVLCLKCHCCLLSINTLRTRQNGRHFPDAFSWMQMYKFQLRFHWSLFLRVQLTIFSTGSDNGLGPNRRQAIIWSNDGLVCWRI